MERDNQNILKKIIQNAISNVRIKIYKKIHNDVNENSFYSDIVEQIKLQLIEYNLSTYSVDTNYNRAIGFDGIGKGVGVYNEKDKVVNLLSNNEFDIVVHLAGEGNVNLPENLIHIEVKKYNNRKDRKKDKDRLLSTTRFSDELSTRKMGLIINPAVFDSFYAVYREKEFYKIRAQQINSELPQIKKVNEEIYNTLKLGEIDEWFSNIIAGYQLGVFIDIGLTEINLIFYELGKESSREIIFF